MLQNPADQLAEEQRIAQYKSDLRNRLLYLTESRIEEVSDAAAIELIELRTQQIRLDKDRSLSHAIPALNTLTQAVNDWQHSHLLSPQVFTD